MRGRVPLLIAVLASVLLAGCSDTSGSTPSPAAGEVLGGTDSGSFNTRYYLNATLEPPITRYNVITYTSNPIFGPTGGERLLGNESYTYTWSTTNACGRFEKLGQIAIWHHGDDTNCDHESPSHPGTITVVIGGFGNNTSSTGYGTCEYPGGSNTGRSKECFVSSVAPEGQEPARRTSLPWSLPAALVGVAVAALLLSRRR